MNWKQSRDIRKGVKLLTNVLASIKVLMSRERAAYESIAEERGIKAGIIIEYLIENGRVTSLPLLQKVPTSLGLKLIGAEAPVADPLLKAGLAEIAKMQFERQAFASAAAANAMINVFDDLAESHRSFGKEHGAGIAHVAAWIERAQVYLDEINELRKKKEK